MVNDVFQLSSIKMAPSRLASEPSCFLIILRLLWPPQDLLQLQTSECRKDAFCFQIWQLNLSNQVPVATCDLWTAAVMYNIDIVNEVNYFMILCDGLNLNHVMLPSLI